MALASYFLHDKLSGYILIQLKTDASIKNLQLFL